MHVSAGTVQLIEGVEEREGFEERLQPHAVACSMGPMSLRAPFSSDRLPFAVP